MKKTLLVLALAGMSLALSAQQQGDMYVSGSLGITGGNSAVKVNVGNDSQKTVTPNAFNFDLGVEYGYFVLDRLAVNIGIGYSMEKSEPNDNSTADQNFFNFTNVFSITPGVNYYFPLGEKIWYNPGLYLNVGFGNYKVQQDSTTSSKYGLTQFGLGLSLISFEFRPLDHIGITLKAGDLTYDMTSIKVDDSVGDTKISTKITSNNVDLGLNLGTSIAFRYYF